MTTVIRVEGQDWQVEAVREDGNKLIVTVQNGQEIITGGAVAALVRAAFAAGESSQKSRRKK